MQGKYYQQWKEQGGEAEYAVRRNCDRGFAVIYQGTQEECERYARTEGNPDNPYWVEHLESGYSKRITPAPRAEVYNLEHELVFSGSLEECQNYAQNQRQDAQLEVWLEDWRNLSAHV